MERSVLLGEYDFTLDAKNRVAVPARLRPAFVSGIFLTRGFDKAIAAYPPEEWDRLIARRAADLDERNEQARMIQRYTFANAGSDKLDGQGRIKVPVKLLDFSGITRDVTILGLQDHIEVWDRVAWAAYRKRMEEGADAVANQLAHQ
jgi:MraZ protein